MVVIDFLTANEFKDFGFDDVANFDNLLKRAEITINLFLDGFYNTVDFETDIESRKKAVKIAIAFQITYLDATGIMTADAKQSMSSVSLGRTSISYKESSKTSLENSMYNLSLDAINALKSVGFGYRGVGYDRY
ncbi:phage protein [Streptococcus porcinus]|nr:phage protein [Streptococcus porcinus]